MITRRRVLTTLAATAATGFGLAGYAVAIEPMWRLAVTRYRISSPRWPSAMPLRIAILADLHICKPYLTLQRLERIVAETNALGADVILLLGDFIGSHRFVTAAIPPADWAPVLASLKAPLGVHTVLGNHDWWEDYAAQRNRRGPVFVRTALEAAGLPVYENDLVRLSHKGKAFWLLGLADQIAFIVGRNRFIGLHDLPGTLARVTDDAPVILLAHEPDIFPNVPDRVVLTLSGHTHGGQIRLFGYSPVVPSQFGNRYAYGHIVEGDRHLIVSGGLGCSIMPVRFGVPPEIVLVDIA